ncbi:MAG: HD domain-containing protein [Lachnospiraceae bacterium]|nr:HD domain-containing protein [Lachnospiraceae bacterium]
MRFVKWEDLRDGMRLARPIYNKSGVLLYERDARLTAASIESVKNFGLLGIYILEPAEPLPPMSEEDLEFERFEIKMVSQVQDEIERLLSTGKQKNLPTIVSQIVRQYCYLDNKIHFYQNLRSKDDYIYRHMFNTAILCAMMASKMNISVEDRLLVITAALIHDIGKAKSKSEAVYGGEVSYDERELLYEDMLKGTEFIESAMGTDGIMLKRICSQAIHAQMDFDKEIINPARKMLKMSDILMVASRYDELTGMNLSGEAESELKAVKELVDFPNWYNPDAVEALTGSIFILFPGVSVELNTGEKALVISENPKNILKPTVISFKDNSILDLSSSENDDLYVVDVMKTLDNRYVMDKDQISKMGVDVNA